MIGITLLATHPDTNNSNTHLTADRWTDGKLLVRFLYMCLTILWCTNLWLFLWIFTIDDRYHPRSLRQTTRAQVLHCPRVQVPVRPTHVFHPRLVVIIPSEYVFPKVKTKPVNSLTQFVIIIYKIVNLIPPARLDKYGVILSELGALVVWSIWRICLILVILLCPTT